MHVATIAPSLTTLFDELIHGPTSGPAYMLNEGDRGLLGSLERISAVDASTGSHGGATVAAHTDHLRYGLSLVNRWSPGEDPFASADWSGSWRISTVSEPEWHALRSALAAEARRWREALSRDRSLDTDDLNVVLGSVAHLAYHLGAIRQIVKATRGPKETQ
jgi:hypothetical protein